MYIETHDFYAYGRLVKGELRELTEAETELVNTALFLESFQDICETHLYVAGQIYDENMEPIDVGCMWHYEGNKCSVRPYTREVALTLKCLKKGISKETIIKVWEDSSYACGFRVSLEKLLKE